MGPAVLVLNLDPVPEISALVPVGLAVRSYPNSPFAWPSLVRIAPSRQPRSLGSPAADRLRASLYGGLYVQRRRQSGTNEKGRP